ncbi:MAG: alpha-amylase family protein [Anaerolineaceae bacterium]|nr:alpha-amylase family protein [Anaerolineaceae bacterium]
MKKSQHLPDRAERSLARLLPRLEAQNSSYISSYPAEWQIFQERLRSNFKVLFDLLIQIYGSQYDFFYHLENLLNSLAKAWIDRPDELKNLDRRRDQDASWFQSNKMVGGICYVDLFAGDLGGLRQHIPYLKELGLTYLHLMPLFCSPKAENDGGYAINSYREVEPALGTMQQLAELASDLRRNGISLVLDFVFNHTSDEHEWADCAKAGDPVYQNYYLMFPDRQLPDAYERTLREIFPDEHPGAFTFFSETESWVWTTFHSYQWDLNYQNPEVFIAMVQEMLSLANIGVEILRLDAVAFIWKKMGTSCENLPEAHLLIQAFNAAARIAAPALLFKSEAIVAPDDVIRYISPGECQISYNPLLMALMWESLATREVKLLSASMRERYSIPDGCSWVNYVRCHDDIGWTFSDDDSWKLGINGYDHRRFLNSFYKGQFPGSFARGLPFQENPKTGDCRISGTCASLAGLEKAITEETAAEVNLAIARILLMHGIILFIGGIPLIYLGDELGTLNDYSYRDNLAKSHDSRWVHRPKTDWSRVEKRLDPQTIEGRIFAGLQSLIAIRKKNDVFSDGEVQMVDCGSHVLGFMRTNQAKRVLVLANFCEKDQVVQANLLRIYGLGYKFRDLVSKKIVHLKELTIKPYQLMVLQ